MAFKYNDKLVIRDRQQMEDLFKHRLKVFDQTRTKTISFTNHTGTVLQIRGNFDRKHQILDLYIEEAPNVNMGQKDVNIVLGHRNKATVELVTKVDLED